GMAVSVAMVSTTLGAVAGPNLVTPLGYFARMIGVPELAGPFILAAVAYLAAGLILFIFLRPDPLLVAQQIAIEEKDSVPEEKQVKTIDRIGVIVGALVLILSHVIMVAIMTMKPGATHDYGKALKR